MPSPPTRSLFASLAADGSGVSQTVPSRREKSSILALGTLSWELNQVRSTAIRLKFETACLTLETTPSQLPSSRKTLKHCH